jgi:hypothetical protein
MFVACAMLSNPSKSWLQWIIAFGYIGASFFNLYVDKHYKEEETERIREAISKIQARVPKKNSESKG